MAREHQSYQGMYEPRFRDMQVSPEPRYHEEHADMDPTEQVFEVLIDQGIAGVGLIFLSWFIWKTNGQARTDRRELEGRLIALIEKTNTTLVEQKSELGNIGRELERLR